MSARWAIVAAAVAVAAAAAVFLFVNPGVPQRPRCSLQAGGGGAGVPNPAAAYCQSLGYQYRIEKGPNGEYGVCSFPDGSECEEWAFFRGECGTQWTYCERFCGGTIVPEANSSLGGTACEVNGVLYPEWELCSSGTCGGGG